MLMPYIQKAIDFIGQLIEKWEGLDQGTKDMIIKIAAVAAAIGPVLVAIGSVLTAIGAIMTVIPMLVTALAGPIGIIALIVAAIVALGVVIYKNWDDIKAWAAGLVESVKELVKNFVEKIHELKEKVLTKLGEMILNAYNKVEEMKKSIKDKIESMKTDVVNKFQTMKTNVIEKVKGLKDDAVKKFEEIKTKIKEKIDGAKDKAVEAFVKMKDAIKEKIVNIKTEIETGFENAVKYIKDLPGKAFQWGADIIGGIVDGIRSMIDQVGDAASSIADKIREFIHFSEPDKGPLSDFHTYMPDMINEMVKGINAGVPKLESAMNNAASALIPNGGVQNNRSITNANQITMNVYGAPGQSIDELYEVIQNKMNQQVYMNEAVFA